MKKNLKRAVVAIDYDNVSSALKNKDEQLDFSGLILKLVAGFSIDAIRLFIPYPTFHLLPPNVNALGYEIVVCQKMGGSEKREDKVDSYMYTSMRNFLEYKEVKAVIILSHDKHSLELLSEAVKKGKEVVYFAEEDQFGAELKGIISEYDIKVYPLPAKERRHLR